MEDIKSVFAKNVIDLRTAQGWTQAELAEKLHYSDKAVSKWERGESIPEISTLMAIADLFGVSLDYLVRGKDAEIQTQKDDKQLVKNRIIITCLSVLVAWFVAALVFVAVDIIPVQTYLHLLSFLYAIPVSMIIWLVFNSIWFNPRRNYIIISLLIWSLLAAIYLTLLFTGHNYWQLFCLGIPGQAAVILWSNLRYGKPNT